MTSIAQPMSVKKKFIISRNIDFWMIGGGSILFMCLAHFFERFKAIPQMNQQLSNIGATASFLALIVNNPHFMITYKMAYPKGWQSVKQNYWQLLLVPLILVLGFAATFFYYKAIGTDFMKWSVMLMYLTVGWHYSKQAFGCTMVYAHFDEYKMSRIQKEAIRYQLLSVWWISYLQSHVKLNNYNYYGLSYQSLNLGTTPYELAMTVWTLLTVFVVVFVFIKKYQESGQLPSVNMLVPWVAMNVWWHPWFRHETFFMILVAFFHCLQYWAFVYKIESTQLAEKDVLGGQIPQLKNFIYIFVLLGVTWLYFDLVPYQIDQALDVKNKMGLDFFVMSAILFINIHHYFLDNVIWKFNNSAMKKYLL